MKSPIIFYHDGNCPINFPCDTYEPDSKGFYYWDVNYNKYFGPFNTEHQCEDELNKYVTQYESESRMSA